MARDISRLKGRVERSLRLPGGDAWLCLAGEAAWSLPLAVLLCAAGGLVEPGWTEAPGQLVRLAAMAFVAPALGEELLFRAALLPPPGEPGFRRSLALSTALFVLWHPSQALLFGPHWGAVVLNPGFLAAVAVMGVALGRLYRRTGSVWPCVALHWLVVVGWKAFFGAPSPWIGG